MEEVSIAVSLVAIIAFVGVSVASLRFARKGRINRWASTLIILAAFVILFQPSWYVTHYIGAHETLSKSGPPAPLNIGQPSPAPTPPGT